jgi:hypothetical protein
VNLYGVLACCRAVIPGMINAQPGRLITIISDVGLEVYSAAKAGAAGLTHSLGRHNITANCVTIGITNTPAVAHAVQNPDMTRKVLSNYIIRRVGEPADAAAMVTFLAFLVPWFIGPAYLGTGYLAWVVATVLLGDVRRNSSWLTTFGAPVIDRLGPVDGPHQLHHPAGLDLGARRRLLRCPPRQFPGLDLHRLPVHAGLRLYLGSRGTYAGGSTVSDLQAILPYAGMALQFFVPSSTANAKPLPTHPRRPVVNPVTRAYPQRHSPGSAAPGQLTWWILFSLPQCSGPGGALPRRPDRRSGW